MRVRVASRNRGASWGGHGRAGLGGGRGTGHEGSECRAAAVRYTRHGDGCSRWRDRTRTRAKARAGVRDRDRDGDGDGGLSDQAGLGGLTKVAADLVRVMLEEWVSVC